MREPLIRDAITQFYREKMASNNRRFWPMELRDYIRDYLGFTPNSVERRLREARDLGAVNYELVSRGHPECEYQVLELDVVREDVRRNPRPEPDEAMKRRADQLLRAVRLAKKKNLFLNELRKRGGLEDTVQIVQALARALRVALETQNWKVIAEADVLVEILEQRAMRDSWEKAERKSVSK
jgi:hypothetical protein